MPQSAPSLRLVWLATLVVGCAPGFPSFPASEELDGAAPPDVGTDGPASNTSGQTDSSLLDQGRLRPSDAQMPIDMDDITPPKDEVCDGLDNDQDRQIDEDFEVGQPCDTGRPGCYLDGLFVCAEDGGRRCETPAVPNQNEQCNGADDDCDGEIDEGINGVGQPCDLGQGICRAEGFTRCAPDGSVSCDAIPSRSQPESCNQLDDDCDGVTDEDLRLRAPCTVGNGICQAQGEFVCGDNGAVVCSAELDIAEEELCDGIDNDCDGPIDEDRACGPYIESTCRIYLGWADRREGPVDGDFGVSDSFGNCPREDSDSGFRERCQSTRQDGLMSRLSLPDAHRFNHDDLLSVAFTCEDAENPALAQWVESRCQVSVGYVPDAPPVVPQERWGTCPAADGSDGDYRCVSTAGDRRFHTMVASDRNVNPGGAFAVAFYCQDEDVNRATAVQGAVQVTFAWGMRYIDEVANGVETWPNCAGGVEVDETDATCAQTLGLGLYIPMPVTRELVSRLAVDDRFAFGIGLRALPRD